MAKRLTRAALLTAAALILFTVEAQLPPLYVIPGMKLGLSNIITVYAMFALGPADTFAILLVRILLASAFSPNPSAALYSLTGGIACYLVMLPMRKIVTNRQIWVCSVFGAMAHNLGQILAAAVILKTASVFVYLPVLLLVGIFAGLFTGLCAQLVLMRLKKQKSTVA